MSTTAAAPPVSARVRRQLRTRWERWRWPVVVAAVVLASAVIGLVLLRPTSQAYLDPDSAGPQGARAVVHVLSDHGVPVRRRTDGTTVQNDVDAAGGHATVAVARTDLLTPSVTDELGRLLQGTPAHVVLVGPPASVLADLGLSVGVEPTVSAEPLDPRCADELATRAGRAVLGGTAYSSRSATAACYPTDEGTTYLTVPSAGGGQVTLLGSGEPLTNDRLADEGDAALAVGVLGQQPLLVWWTPTPAASELGQGEASLRELLPRPVMWILGQLLVVLLVVALWRGRRFGRLVTEPLPVVVRSVETTLGRAALYRRARARGRAAQVLRAAAGRRIAVRCGLPRTAPPSVVAAVAAERARSPVATVAALLSGAAPAADGQLVALARDLDSLESALQREAPHP
jgi:hypothetical protein